MSDPTKILRLLADHPLLGSLGFESIDLAGMPALAVEHISAEVAVEAWRAANELVRDRGMTAVLTDEYQVHPDIEPVVHRPAVPLEQARAQREQCRRRDPDEAALLDALPTATPSDEDYEERDCFLDSPLDAQLGLALVPGDRIEAVLPFTGTDEGNAPSQGELRAFLRHFEATLGAVPLYASGAFLELEVASPPTSPEPLRELARDMVLLSAGCAEGFGVEEPSRLLRRLTHDRIVVWWYGT
jgi:hypothetical protein